MANLKAHRPKVSESMDLVNSEPAVSMERAAELSGSSVKSIQRAKAIVKEGIMSSAVFTLPQIKTLSTGRTGAAMAEILTPFT